MNKAENLNQPPTQQVPHERVVSHDEINMLRRLAKAASAGAWEYGGTPCEDSNAALAICRENINLTEEPGEYFFEVYLPDGKRTALVGNGPNGWANAEYIATAGPETMLRLLDALELAISG